MNLLSYLTKQLKNVLTEIHAGKQTLPDDSILQLFNSQSDIASGTILLATADDIYAILQKTNFEDGSCLILTDAEPTCCTKALRIPSFLPVFESCLTLPGLFNRLNQKLQDYQKIINSIAPELIGLEQTLSDFWQKISRGEFCGHDAIFQETRKILPECNRYYRILIFHRTDNISDIQSLQESIPELLPDIHLFRSQPKDTHEFLALQFFSNQSYNSVQNSEALNQLLKKNGITLMISNATQDYGCMYMLYQLTCQAHHFAENIKNTEQSVVHFFESYTMYSVLDLCSQRFCQLYGNMDIIYLAHPIIIHLLRYDQKHGTNLREVLYQYLVSDRNLKATAQILYMHRNTVSNKLNLIQKICPVNFDDGELNQRLLFSCQLVEYYENILHQILRI